MGSTGGRTPPSKLTVLLLIGCALAALWALAMLIPGGQVSYVYFWYYSEFYMGVISLVALSTTIMIGLVATDRLVLSIRQRVLLQSAHRTTGVIAVAALFVHVWTKLMEHHIRVIDIFIPFLFPGGNRGFVGMGTISGLIMVLVMWTGIARARFIGRGKPWMWRSVHAISYLMWPIALVHGLSAGRPAATWVTVSYVICILGVLVGLAVRLSVSLNRRKDFSSTSTGSIKPVGSLVPTSSPAPKKRAPSRRRDADPMQARVVADRGNAPAAVLEAWVPASRPVSPSPAYDEPYKPASRYVEAPYEEARPPRRRAAEEDERPTRSSRRAAEEDERPTRSSRRYAEEAPVAELEAAAAPRQRRPDPAERFAAPADRYDEPTSVSPSRRTAPIDDPHRYAGDPAPRIRRRAEEDPYEDDSRTRARRVVEENRAARATRYAEDDEPIAPRSRRAARRYADEEETPAPRARRRAAEDDVPPRRGSSGEARRSGAHSGEFMTGELRPGYDMTGEFRMDEGPVSPRSRSRYAEDEPRPRRGGVDRSIDRADSGRHSRAEFVDLSAPADPWGAPAEPIFLEGDDTPTLVDMASRRARRAGQQQDVPRGATSRGARRAWTRDDDEGTDDRYWRQIRGEAQ
jgi:hypothetical protein